MTKAITPAKEIRERDPLRVKRTVEQPHKVRCVSCGTARWTIYVGAPCERCEPATRPGGE